MKKKLTMAIIAGFVSLITGLILAGIGFFSGGITSLEKIATPKQIHQTYTNLHTLKLDFIHRNITIRESTDDNYHITYTNSKNHIFPSLKISEKDGVLTLTAKDRELSITGIMQFFGEHLASNRTDAQTVIIRVPKNKGLAKLEGNHYPYYYGSSPLTIENVHIKEVNLSARLHLNNVQMDGGTIDTSYVSVDQSKLKNISVSVSNSEESVKLSDTSLENVKIQGYQNLHVSNATLLGENIFTPTTNQALTVTNLDLTDKSLQDLNLNISTKTDMKSLAKHLGYHYNTEEELKDIVGNTSYFKEQVEHVGIFTKDKYEKLTVKQEGDKQTLTLEKKGSKNKLTLGATNATINLRTPN